MTCRYTVGQQEIGNTMAWVAKKTEHAGSKKGTGAFYGRNANAKRGSNRKRRQDSKYIINADFRGSRN